MPRGQVDAKESYNGKAKRHVLLWGEGKQSGFRSGAEKRATGKASADPTLTR